MSKGEFIQFLDGDDLLAPDKIEKQVAMLDASPDVDVVYGDVRRFQTDAGAANWQDWDTQDYPDMLATLLSSEGNGAGLLPDSMMFRRRVLELVGLWTESSLGREGNKDAYIGSDQDYWLRAAWSGCRFKYCPGSLSLHRKRSGQLTSNSRSGVRGMEPVLVRARQYITREPYRTMVSQRLSRTLFYLAVSDGDASTEESLRRLRKAREANPAFVTLPALVIGRLLIITGIGPFLFSRWLKPVRQLSSRLAGMKKGC
jgi:Glycosyltransferase like family 2